MEPIEPGQRAPAPPPLAEVRPGLPPALVAALEGAVQLDRDRRIADVETFMERLTKVAPPAPKPEEEPGEETPLPAEPTEWVALPVPRMPRRSAISSGEVEVPREAAREIGAAAHAATSSEPAEPTAPPPAPESQPTTDAAGKVVSSPQFAPSPVPPRQVPADRKPGRSPKGATLRDASAATTAEAAAPASEQGRPEPARAEQPRLQDMQAEPARVESVRPPAAAVDTPMTAAAGLGSAAAALTGPDTTRAEPAGSQAPPAPPRAAKPSTPTLSDVELPPPEPVRFADLPPELVRFADLPPELVRDQTARPLRGRTRGAPRSEPMRGGLAATRPPKGRSRASEVSSGPPAPPPLQPIWDTPAEFPLPVMPDPRPMPADAATGVGGAARRRWTRRGIGIAAAALVLGAAAVTLARMERAPDTTAELMEPENPTGYGGDVVLTPRTGDTTARDSVDSRARGITARDTVGRDTTARDTTARDRTSLTTPPRERAGSAGTSAGAAAPSAAGARPARDVATPEPTQPTTPLPTGRRTPPASEPAAPSRSPTPGGGTAAAPAGAPAPTAARSAGTGPCSSPALADQRACLVAAVERTDAGLNQVYGDVIAAMRQRASTAPGDPDPPEVQRLRAAQRSWLARRDAECRRRGRGREGPLWATSRAQCFAEFSTSRNRDLSATLERLRRD
jgi:uncharacterized protein YecT (DUF1311 family)